MKIFFYFLLAILIFLSENFNAQQNQCNLEGTHKNAFTVIPPPSTFKYRTSLQKTATAIIQTHYNVDNPPPINARPAIEYAVEIWTYLIKTSFNQIITIDVSWKNLGYSQAGYTLAQCGPTSYYNSSSLPHPETQYPIALAEYLLNQNLNEISYEMSLTINSHDSINWVLNTDGIPVQGRPDLVSIVLHEVTHGLSFNTSFSVNGSLGYKGIDSFPLFASGSYPTVYDRFGVIGSYFPNPDLLINDPDSSPELRADLTSDTVFFNGDNAWIQNGNILPKLYVPTGWKSGSSFTHLDDIKFPAGNSNSLMTHETDLAEVIHSPGEVGLAILQDNGWDVNRLATFIHPQPGVALLRGAVDTIKWTDNTGGAFSLKLLNAYDTPVLTICNLGSADRGLNNFVWNVPNDITLGYYKIRIESATDGYFGVTTIFTITNMLQVAAPVFNPPPHWYPDPVNVTASCATSEATIRYTTDGNEPSITSPIFPSSLPVSSLTTIKGKAFKTGMLSSATTIATYSIGIMPTTPEITPGDGTYVQNTTFWISWPNNLYCFASMTFDGSEPTDPSVNGQLLSTNPNGTVCIYTGTARVKARTKNANGDWSSLAERTYTIVHGVVVKQLDASSNPFGQAAYWNTNWNYVDPDGAVSLNEDQNHFLSTQQFKPGTHQKFNNWEDNLPNTNNWFRNWDSISVYANTTLVQSHFADAYSGIEIKNILEATAITGGNILFKDPWLTDINEAPYGMRNRGLDAIFKNRLSPFYPDYGTGYGSDTTKGIFLNQGGSQFTPPYYSVQAISPQPIDLQGSIGERNFYFVNWIGTDVSLQDADNVTSGVVFNDEIPNQDPIVTANLHGQGLSDNQEAYSSNNQRKIIRTNDGVLHSVYESMEHVWYETSSDNGQHWTLNNGARPLDNGYGENPSVAWINIDDAKMYVAVVFQQKESVPGYSDSYSIQLNIFGGLVPSNPIPYNKIQSATIYSQNSNTHNEATPVIAIKSGDHVGGVFIVWHTNSGFKFEFGGLGLSNPPYTPINGPNSIGLTSSISINPSLETYNGENNPGTCYLVWEENNAIKYASLNASGVPSSMQTISNQDGYTYKSNPSHIVLDDSYSRVCWKGSRYVYQIDPDTKRDISYWDTRVVFRGINNLNHTWSFGQNVGSPNINKNDGQNYYTIIWNENENSTFFADNTLFSVRQIDSYGGRGVQVSNGTTKDEMFAEVFNTASSPYYLKPTNSIGSYYVPQKINNYAFGNGREGIIAKDSAQFYFTVGDIKVDGHAVDFIAIPDSIIFNSKEILNEYLITEPFQLSDNSGFLYSIQYGITDSSSAAGLLDNSNNFISFKLQLLDAQTSEVLGTFDEVTYDQSNIFQYSSLCYQVNTAGIGNHEVYLKLISDDNIIADYSLGEIYSDGNILSKAVIKNKNIDDLDAVTSYSLTQNYPNPFNPVTQINYQLPEQGFVSIKVYDILGAEVASLVNEQKTQGRYSVNFDASKLASGVYIYRLQVNDYVSSKKMLLLK